MTRNHFLLLVAVLTTSAMTFPPSAAASSHCEAIGTGTCTFSDGETLKGSYTYDTIIIPAGVTVFADGPVTLQATFNLEIAGTLIGSAVNGIGDSITLRSAFTATISGEVIAASGAPGGSIVLAAQDFDISGRLRSGDGDAGDFDSRINIAIGDAGHAGGDIVLAGAGSITGVIHVGNGGKGGNAYAWGNLGKVVSVGGDGGRAGDLLLPPLYSIAGLYASGSLVGAIGGSGGEAYATHIGVPLLIGEDGTPDYDAGEFKCGGANARSFHEHGGDGCRGGGAFAFGGNGEYGPVEGGKGGKATSVGGPGGNGGHGARGIMVETMGYRSSDGGRGGTGGQAFTKGGNGGPSEILGGPGGDVKVTSGDGGNGGNGGDGYGIWNSWEPDYCKSYGPPAYCYHGTSSERYCEPAGQGGPAGGTTSMTLNANPGQGGWNTLRTHQGDPGTIDPASSLGASGVRGGNGIQAWACGPPPYQVEYKSAL